MLTHCFRYAGAVYRVLPLIILAAASCVPARPSVEVHTYLLSPDGIQEAVLTAPRTPTATTLLVNVPKGQPGFDTPRIAYLLRPHEVNYYAKSQWADSPTRMLSPLLVQVLEQFGAWQAVVQGPSLVRAQYRLDIEDLALQQEFFQKPSRVRLTLRAQYVDLRKQCVMGTAEFEALEEASSEDAYGGVLAANRAVAQVLPQLAEWATSYMTERIQHGC